ncbi:glycosyltransferase family 4 protein [Protaetiibacter larvae]|uniref:glycosyltransferase family 4 protein n=1 Tax=Protaetiibacter larvae TaxID=2592654 RepID=UPI00143D0BB5|nr:glycosyltransferase family 1 protein [Protaetiibacter larvae]
MTPLRRIVDITYLAHWPGRVTGIPRVISEYCRRARPDDVFVVWENETRRFVEVDPLGTAEQHGRGIAYRLRGGRGVGVARALRFGGAGRASRELRRLGAARGSERVSALARRLARFRALEHREVLPGAQDVFVTFMGQWHDQSYIDAILAADVRGAAVVQFSYDMLPIVAPHLSGHSTVPMTSYLTQVLPVTDLVLSISENSRRDLVEWAAAEGVAHGPVEVFRLGDDFGSVRDSPERTGVPDELREDGFVLCVGTVEARKNHVLLYYVYRAAVEREIDLPPLVVVGREGWHAGDVFRMLQDDPALRGRVHVLSDASDEALAWLYANCRFTIYPSMYEGWGLPVAESLAWGKPVVASRSSSMPEIAGELIDYFDPFSQEECMAAILRLTGASELQEALGRVRRYRPTPWSDVVDVLNRLIGAVTAA